MMNPIIIFDDECLLCNRSVGFIIRHDKHSQFRFTHPKSATADALKNKFESFPLQQSILLIENNILYTESEAVLRIASRLNTPWSWFSAFRIVPKFIRNFIYKKIAQNRSQWFGKCDACMVINASNRHLFLN